MLCVIMLPAFEAYIPDAGHPRQRAPRHLGLLASDVDGLDVTWAMALWAAGV